MIETPRSSRAVAPSLVAGLAIALTGSLACADLGDQVLKLLSDDGPQNQSFGRSVGISGNILVTGAEGDDDNGNHAGAVYLFDLSTGQQIAKLFPDDPAPDDAFGTSVAISGTIVIVGSPRDDDHGHASGAAYLFDATTGEQITKLLPEDAELGDYFGSAVAICGTTAVIGARYDRDNGIGSGSAYVFDTTTGEQIAKLLAEDGFNQDNFGESVAISGSRTVIGAENGGAAYIFDTTTGEQIARLLPDNKVQHDRFGASVAIEGNSVLVGAPSDDDDGPRSGSVYRFDATTGEQIAKLSPGYNEAADRGPDRFGVSVAICGTTAIVGAQYDDDSASYAGAAHLLDLTTGEELAKLFADDGTPDDYFGQYVALNDTTAVIGVPRYENYVGAVYVFDADRSLCRADLDASGAVGFTDILRVLRAWGDQDAPEDLDGCGTVDALDLRIVIDAWGACD